MNKKIIILITLLFLIINVGIVSAENTNQRDDNLEITDSKVTSVNEPKSFNDLNNDLDKSPSEGINFTSDYKFNNTGDKNFTDGITMDFIPESTYVINGNNHIIDADNQSAVFKFNHGTVIINNLKICNAKFSSIIINDCELRTNNVTFENCYDSESGAAIFAQESNYYSSHDKFINNYAKKGASICSLQSIIDINNSTFTSNEIYWSLIYGYNSIMTINNTVFSNMTSKYATAIYSEKNKLTVLNSIFINLFANATAGAIGSKESNSITVNGCTFINVSSAKNAGAIYADLNGNNINLDNTATIIDSVFENCSSNLGGSYLQLGGKLNIAKTSFINNTAEYIGGAIFLSNTTALIGSCKFDKNTANQLYGGALYIDDSDSIINNVEFSNNFANTYGDAIYLYGSKYDVKNSKFTLEDKEAVVSFFDRYNSNFNKNNQLNGGKTLLNQVSYNTIVDYEGNDIKLIENPTANASASDSRFDLRDYIINVNGTNVSLAGIVKNQGSNGACWAFGATGALESAFLKSTGILLDLSENNIQGIATRYNEFGTNSIIEGGYVASGLGLFLSWLGVISTEYDNYDELGKISIASYVPFESYHIQDAVIIPKRTSSTDNDKLKEALVKYGGLTVHIYGDSADNEYYNPVTHAQYYNGVDFGNHFVTLVGWDDNYSKDNFKIKPNGNGAWICKNSWGTDWGENGYFYVSYYDTSFARYAESVGYIINNTENYTTVYQYDIGAMDGYFKDNGKVISFINFYEAIDNELIKAVGTYFENANENYTIKVYVNNALTYTQTGKSTHGGFETIKLDKQIIVNAGNIFSVEIQAKALPLLEDTRIHFENEKSIIYFADGSADDLGRLGKTACIKVYTSKTNITGKSNSQYYSKNNITIKSDAEGKIISIIDENGEILGSAEVKKGKASFNITLETGEYSIITSCDEGDIVEGFEIFDSIVITDNVKIGYNSELTLAATFYDEEGVELFESTITGLLDGKLFEESIENINGTLYLTLPDLSIGTHTLILQNPKTSQTSTTTIKVVSRFSGNSNVNMYYGDESSFKVKIYDGDGNPAGANQIVSINLNKVTYYVKTDSNSYAILKIPNTVKSGIYTLTTTYAGQSIKNTIKITNVLNLAKVKVKKSAKK